MTNQTNLPTGDLQVEEQQLPSQVTIFAPATTANLSVGFDVLGMAVQPIDGSLMGDMVQVAESELDTVQLDIIEEYANQLPNDYQSNLVYQAYLLFKQEMEKRELPVRQLRLGLQKNMPVGSGLGSSACSSVAALVALNQFHGNQLNQQQLLKLMGELEGQVSGSVHFDNVAPSYLGGLQMITPHGDNISEMLPTFDDWYWVLAYPGIKINTADARNILPDSYSRADIVAQSANMANFIHGLYSKDLDLTAKAMKDKIAEPYREQLLPNLAQVKQGLDQLGAIAHGISGSGPSYYAICKDLETAQKVEQLFREQYLQNANGFVKICQTDVTGAREVDAIDPQAQLRAELLKIKHHQNMGKLRLGIIIITSLFLVLLFLFLGR